VQTVQIILSQNHFPEPNSHILTFSSSNFYAAGSHTKHHWRCSLRSKKVPFESFKGPSICPPPPKIAFYYSGLVSSLYYKSSVGMSDFFWDKFFASWQQKWRKKKVVVWMIQKTFFWGLGVGGGSWAQITILWGKRILKSPYKKQ